MNMNQKGFANITLIVIVVAVIAIGMYFALVKKPVPVTQEQTPTVAQPATPSGQTGTPSKNITPTPAPTKPSGAADLPVGKVMDINIQSPHPYPNGTSEKPPTLVWSQTLTKAGATFLRLHFARLEMNGQIRTPSTPCKSVSEGSLPGSSPGVVPGVRCEGGNRIFTAQEILDNGYVTGDFILIRNKKGELLDVLSGAIPVAKDIDGWWSSTYSNDEVRIELYADAAETAYGLAINQYAWGFR